MDLGWGCLPPSPGANLYDKQTGFRRPRPGGSAARRLEADSCDTLAVV